MNFQKPHGLDLRHLEDAAIPVRQKRAGNARRFRFKTFLWLASGTVAVYFMLAFASMALLLIGVGILVALLGLAAAVCVDAQNNGIW